MATDRRIKYTKMVLKESLLELMKEKPVSRISIKAICEKADINRATYYSHYKDQYDQLNQIEINFIEKIELFLESLTINDPVEIVKNIFDYIQENREMCCILLSPNGDIAFEEKVCALLRSTVLASWQAKDVEEFSADDYIYTYIVTGGVGMVKKWLCDNSGKYSSLEMATLMLSLTEKGTGGFHNKTAI